MAGPQTRKERIMLQLFATAVGELQGTLSDAFNPYRPELHYMRGPGPACRAKAYYIGSRIKKATVTAADSPIPTRATVLRAGGPVKPAPKGELGHAPLNRQPGPLGSL